MTDNWDGKPPGSYEAIDAGYTCSVMDNCHGKGWGNPPNWWITESCPLHGVPDKFKEEYGKQEES